MKWRQRFLILLILILPMQTLANQKYTCCFAKAQHDHAAELLSDCSQHQQQQDQSATSSCYHCASCPANFSSLFWAEPLATLSLTTELAPATLSVLLPLAPPFELLRPPRR